MNVSRSNIIVFRISLAVAVSGILMLATTPLSYPVISGSNDKLNHIFAFFVLSLLADLSFPDKGFRHAVLLPLIGYGIIIEVIQYFLPYRMFSFFDVAADAIGIILYKISFLFMKKGADAVSNKKQL